MNQQMFQMIVFIAIVQIVTDVHDIKKTLYRTNEKPSFFESLGGPFVLFVSVMVWLGLNRLFGVTP